METHKYDALMKINHWISATIILWATISGIYVAEMSNNIRVQETISFINVSLTTILIPFFLFRFIYRYLLKPRLSELAAFFNHANMVKAAHHLMYVLIFIVLVSGVFMMDRDINVFNWFIIPQPIDDATITHKVEVLHKYACRALAILILLHIGAVIKHQLAGKKILKKML